MKMADTSDPAHRGNLRRAFLLSVPVAMAYVPLGFALGVYLVDCGIAWYWAPLSALLIFAGSVEFLAVSFIVGALNLSAVAGITAIVNFRHVFYGLSFPLSRLPTFWQKAYGVFALTDETYAIVCAGQGRDLRGREITFLQIISHSWWFGGAFLGALFRGILPPDVSGFDFALTGMFVILALDALQHAAKKRLIWFALLSIILGLAAERWMFDNSFLIAGLVAYLAMISANYLRDQRGKALSRFLRGQHDP